MVIGECVLIVGQLKKLQSNIIFLLLDDMLDLLSRVCIFTKIDLWSGYHQICNHSNDKQKITFKTKDRFYKW